MKKLGKSARSARYLAKGEMQARKGNYEIALDYYQMALEHASDDEVMTIYYCMAHSLAQLGRYAEAKEYADRSLKESEKFAGQVESVQALRQEINSVLEYISIKQSQEAKREHETIL